MNTNLRKKQTIFIKTDDIYKNIAQDAEPDLILQIMNQIDHYLKEKIKK